MRNSILTVLTLGFLAGSTPSHAISPSPEEARSLFRLQVTSYNSNNSRDCTDSTHDDMTAVLEDSKNSCIVLEGRKARDMIEQGQGAIGPALAELNQKCPDLQGSHFVIDEEIQKGSGEERRMNLAFGPLLSDDGEPAARCTGEGTMAQILSNSPRMKTIAISEDTGDGSRCRPMDPGGIQNVVSQAIREYADSCATRKAAKDAAHDLENELKRKGAAAPGPAGAQASPPAAPADCANNGKDPRCWK